MMRSLVHVLALSGALAVLVPACSDGTAGGEAPLGTHAAALELAVPGTYATIQAAIDAAAPGDQVLVADGAYTEDLFLKSDVTLRGASTAGTVVFGSVTVGTSDGVVIDRLTIDRSLAGGGTAVTVTDGSAALSRVRIVGATVGVHVAPSAGLEPADWPTVTIDAARIPSAKSAAVQVAGPANLTITNSEITYATVDGVQLLDTGAAGTVTIAHNVFFANGFGLADGSAVWGQADGGLELANNIVVSNNRGLFCQTGCTTSHNVVWGNAQNFAGAAAAGPGNVNKDPRMKAPGEGDFSLLFDSPAIDAGDPAYGTALDAKGTKRPLGEGFDIGAHEFPAAPPGLTLAISEVMANPLDEGTGEYIELFNHGAAVVDADNLTIYDGDDTDRLAGFQGGPTAIPAGAYAVIVDPDYDGSYAIAEGAVLLTVAQSTTLGSGLSTNDTVSLLDVDGTTPIDGFSFPMDPGNGVSVEKDDIADGDTKSNWLPSPCGMTPGKANCASLPPNLSTQVLVAINEVMANPLEEGTGEFLELYNFGTEPVDLDGMVLSDGDATDVLTGKDGGTTLLQPGGFAVLLDPDYTGIYAIPEGTLLLSVAASATLGNGLATNDPISLLSAKDLVVIDTYTHTVDPGNGVSIEKVAANIGDIQSNYLPSTCATGSSPGQVNCITTGGLDPLEGATIAIMEVMANPLDEDRDEFVELYNYGADPVDLAGFRLSDGDNEEPVQAFVGGGNTVLAPGGYAVVVDQEYAGSFELPAETVLLTTADTSIGSGLSTNDPVSIRAPKGAKKIDTYFFPFDPGNGVSAEKIDILIGDVPSNWTASPCKASPGKANCAAKTGGSQAEVSTTSVVISEVMANPIDEATGEFVEIFNAGPVGVDVAGWKLSDGGAIDTIAGYKGGKTLLAPGQFAIVLDPDYALEYAIPGTALKLTVTNATIGNGLTTSDAVTLLEEDGLTVVDHFSFPFNPGNGISIEKVTLTGGDVQANWVGSTCTKAGGAAQDGSSPGRRSCSDPYGDLTGIQALGEPCPSGASDCLSGLCAIELLTGDTFCTQDCTGAPASCPGGFTCEDVTDPNYDQVCVPVSGGATPNVVVNELFYNAVGADTQAFIELWGVPGTILDGLDLVGVNGADGKDYVKIPLTGQIGEDGFYVVAHPEAPAATLAAADLQTTKADLQNGPDSLQIRKASQVLDAVGYGTFADGLFFAGEGTAAEAIAEGQCLARFPDGADTGDNAADFVVSTPTPGAPNVE